MVDFCHDKQTIPRAARLLGCSASGQLCSAMSVMTLLVMAMMMPHAGKRRSGNDEEQQNRSKFFHVRNLA
jgi:hypothetical protein